MRIGPLIEHPAPLQRPPAHRRTGRLRRLRRLRDRLRRLRVAGPNPGVGATDLVRSEVDLILRAWLDGRDGVFTDITFRLKGFALLAPTFAAAWIDADVDGDSDLYFVNDKPEDGYLNALMLNDGNGLLALADDGLGANVGIKGMGLGIGDVNGDLRPDFLITGWGNLALLLTVGEYGWVDASVSVGLIPDAQRDQVVGWGCELADMDNDGDLDAVVNYGAEEQGGSGGGGGEESPALEPDALYLQGGDGQFTDVGEEWGIADTGLSRGLALGDLNEDGYLDLVKRDIHGPASFRVSQCGEEGWLRIHLRQDGPNPFAIGARVVVQSLGSTQIRWLLAGGTSLGSSGPPEAHFGLGSADSVERLEVFWPDGETSAFANVESRRQVTVDRRESGLRR